MRLKKNKLTVMRAERGITIAELSKRTGISSQTLSTITRRGTCSTVNCGKLARALEVDVLDIMEEE